MEDIVPLILITIAYLAFFAAIILGWYFYIKARNKERMSLIEKGKDVSEIYSKREIKFQVPWLKIGVILTGFSLGWLAAFIVSEVLTSAKIIRTYSDAPLIMGIIFLFTAISILVAYFVDKPKTKQ